MPPLGAFEDVTIILPEPIAMTPGDIFAALSDGLIEAVDPAGNLFGKERIMGVLKVCRMAAAEDILAARVWPG
jgi:serine phosphatase RsbU (regulator of sigma subunit)